MKLYQYYKQNTLRSLLYMASFISAACLGVALVAQYGFGMHPCELCIAQRVPYGIIALLGLLAAMRLKSPASLRKAFFLCLLLFVVDAGIAGYHSGVEAGMFPGPSGCTNNSTGEMTLEEMRAAIMNAALVPCDQPMGYFLGLSFASWNALGATLIALTLTVAYRKSGRGAAA